MIPIGRWENSGFRQQINVLVAHDVDGVHLYSMNHPATTRRIWRNAEPLFRGTQG